jgi:hypothetical protein
LVQRKIKLIRASFGRVVLGHKTVSKKYDTLSTLIGAEALNVQNQEDCMPELKSWVMGILATIFSNLDSLTTEDGDVIARIATSDTSGSLEGSVCTYRLCVSCAATNHNTLVSYLVSNGKCIAKIQRRNPSWSHSCARYSSYRTHSPETYYPFIGL